LILGYRESWGWTRMRVQGLCLRLLFGWQLVGMASLNHTFLRMMMAEQPQWIRSFIVRWYRISTFRSCANSLGDEAMISKLGRSGFNMVEPNHTQREPQDNSYGHSSLDMWSPFMKILIIEWPFYSPDLTPLDFFLWGYLKDCIYANPKTRDIKQLKANIIKEMQNVPQTTWNISKCDEQC